MPWPWESGGSSTSIDQARRQGHVVGHSFGQNQWQACSCAQIEATTDVGEPGLLSAPLVVIAGKPYRVEEGGHLVACQQVPGKFREALTFGPAVGCQSSMARAQPAW